jgi:SAM-dependent methyltransferase
VKDRNAEDWEALARREPYFSVLTDEGIPDIEFLRSGEEDIALLLAAIASTLGHDVPLTHVLDFGCGAGRLTIPLARRAARVVGCDIAPTILEHARRNAREAELCNVTFTEIAELDVSRFDFICSLLTFQHISPEDGYEFIRSLLRLLARGGVFALQLNLEPSGGGLQRLVRMHHQSRAEHRATGQDIRRPSWMQVNAYDERVVNRDVAAAGASVLGRFSTRRGDAAGTVLVIRKER